LIHIGVGLKIFGSSPTRAGNFWGFSLPSFVRRGRGGRGPRQPLPPSYHNYYIDFRENMAKQHSDYDQDFLLLYDLELRTIYYEIREELSNPGLPELRNTDGDEFQSTKLYYTLTCTPR